MVSLDTFTAAVPRRIIETTDFLAWKRKLDGGCVLRLEAVDERIQADGIITGVKSLGDGLYERKWASGLRLYFAVVYDSSERAVLFLLGSGKGLEQNRAIIKARQNLMGRSVYKGDLRKRSENDN